MDVPKTKNPIRTKRSPRRQVPKKGARLTLGNTTYEVVFSDHIRGVFHAKAVKT